ncbi:hypothetical protein ACFPM0_36595 [Pseudonocardia sulfidoxydans]|uniref:hypothetical protein n=1 Tax=Pseudonocardia sulfidoxydans TaxID=54011 RepID=UPI003615254C
MAVQELASPKSRLPGSDRPRWMSESLHPAVPGPTAIRCSSRSMVRQTCLVRRRRRQRIVSMWACRGRWFGRTKRFRGCRACGPGSARWRSVR